MELQRIRLLISYDGTDFHGWQMQTSEQPTIQSTLESALARIFGQSVRVHGSGRTDAGAHSVGQVAHFDAPRDIASYDMRRAINRWLPNSIVVRAVWAAPRDFHSLFSAQRKTYKYWIWNHRVPSALYARYRHWVARPLDMEYLQKCSDLLLGEHDFKSFQTAGTPIISTVRRIEKASWRRVGRHTLEFTICGNGFLKQMVRNIVGTMLDMGRLGEAPSEMSRILTACDRQAARASAPAHGLYLYRVEYPQLLDSQCRKL